MYTDATFDLTAKQEENPIEFNPVSVEWNKNILYSPHMGLNHFNL